MLGFIKLPESETSNDDIAEGREWRWKNAATLAFELLERIASNHCNHCNHCDGCKQSKHTPAQPGIFLVVDSFKFSNLNTTDRNNSP